MLIQQRNIYIYKYYIIMKLVFVDQYSDTVEWHGSYLDVCVMATLLRIITLETLSSYIYIYKIEFVKFLYLWHDSKYLSYFTSKQ